MANKRRYVFGVFVFFLLLNISICEAQNDLQVTDPDDVSVSPDWGEIYITDDTDYVYFLFHNYDGISQETSVDAWVYLDVDNDDLTGDAGSAGADYKFKIVSLSTDTAGNNTKIDLLNYYKTAPKGWIQPGTTYYDEGISPDDINGNQSDSGIQTLPTGTDAPVACGILEYRHNKTWPVGETKKVAYGTVLEWWIVGYDNVGSTTTGNTYLYTFQNDQTRAVDGDTAGWVYAPDSIAPAAISNLTALPGTNDGEITLTWTAPGDDDTAGKATSYIVKYSLTQITDFATQGTAYSQNWQPLTGGSAEGPKTVSGFFTPGTTYYFAIVAVDDNSNEGLWSTVGVNTANFAQATDLTPSAPGNFNAVAGDTEILLTWTAPPNAPDLSHYNVYYDTDTAGAPYTGKDAGGGDSPINVGNVTNYVLTGLVNNVTYYLAVTAVDNTANESNYSIEKTTYPSAGMDIPPVVSIISPTAGATVSGSVTITADATDNEGVTQVEFYIDNQLESTDTTSPDEYSWDTTLSSDGAHIIKVVAYDTISQSATAQINVTVDNTVVPEPVISVNVTTLDFGEVEIGETETLTFTITNSGGGILIGIVTKNQKWIVVGPTTFSLSGSSPGNSQEIYVAVDNNILKKKEGEHTGTVSIKSNAGDRTVTIKLTATCVLAKPNPYDPTKGKLTFFGDGIVPNETTIRIYTLSGELVNNVIVSDSESISWDGKNENGEKVTGGIYIYTYESPNETGVGKFTIIRK